MKRRTVSEQIMAIRLAAGGSSEVCPVCGQRAEAPYRRHDERGNVTEGCADACHTGRLVTASLSAVVYEKPSQRGPCICGRFTHLERCVSQGHPHDSKGGLTPWRLHCLRCAVELARDCFPGLEVCKVSHDSEGVGSHQPITALDLE